MKGTAAASLSTGTIERNSFNRMNTILETKLIKIHQLSFHPDLNLLIMNPFQMTEIRQIKYCAK